MSPWKVPYWSFLKMPKKAFHRLHWGHLQAVLQKFGFVGRILDSILALYSSPSTRVFINSCLSSGFDINNGTWQAIEPLAERIRSVESIRCPVIGGLQLKISLFSDDILLCFLHPEDFLRYLHLVLEEYAAVSYYKLNSTKMEAIPCNISTFRRRLLKTWRKLINMLGNINLLNT